MRKTNIVITNVEESAATDKTNSELLKEVVSILRKSPEAKEKGLVLKTRKKCAVILYEGATYYIVRNIQELKEEQQLEGK